MCESTYSHLFFLTDILVFQSIEITFYLKHSFFFFFWMSLRLCPCFPVVTNVVVASCNKSYVTLLGHASKGFPGYILRHAIA